MNVEFRNIPYFRWGILSPSFTSEVGLLADFMLNVSRVFAAMFTSKSPVLHPQPEEAPYWYDQGPHLTLSLLTWTIWRAPTNASKWRMGFNSAFKGLTYNYAT